MQKKINTFTQAQAEFSAKYDRLQNLNEEQARQEKVFKALQADIHAIQAQQNSESNNSGQFLKQYQQETDLKTKQAGIQQFIQQLEHNRQLLMLELSDDKRSLISAYSDLMEATGNQYLQDIALKTVEPLRNAFLTIQQSADFMANLKSCENILRKNIDPFDFLMETFINLLLENGIKTGENTDPVIQKFTLNFAELDEIPDISPIKVQQMRKALQR